nr:hypothetical protein [Tanacetum cinerariifolium]
MCAGSTSLCSGCWACPGAALGHCLHRRARAHGAGGLPARGRGARRNRSPGLPKAAAGAHPRADELGGAHRLAGRYA